MPTLSVVIGFDLDMTLADLAPATEVALPATNRSVQTRSTSMPWMADLGVPFRPL